MASFKAHISFGIITAAVLSAVLFFFEWVSGLFAWIADNRNKGSKKDGVVL